uniref:Axonemal dynein light chain domain containing 1 n=1 Tax=Maylandia zebra TaxID=106582 RepID=A0A3P9CSN5_9CICH
RPDAVWHHPLGRKKYKHFLEQPTSLTGAGDSFIPEEFHIVKNKGLRSLEFYEAFTVQLRDEEQRLRVLPSRPSGRLEAVQLMGMMDDMLEKAGVDEQSEELAELSQLEGLLELVKVEQNIYNIVFHELIRQVSVGCAERGQLLAKLQRYQSLLDRIPRRLKALHTEVVAQRALDRRLTEEIHHIKLSIHQLSVVQAYHQLYELQRARLEAQLIHMTEDRDCWSQFTLCLALKVISVKQLHLVSQLHISEQSWFKTAEHCILFLTSKDTECINIIMESTDYWRKQLAAFMSQLKQTEHAHCAQISAIQQGINKWLSFCSSNNLPEPKYDKTSVEEIHADLQQWSNMLALLCEHYQGEKQLNCQQTLSELSNIQETWLNMSLQLFRRHPSADGGPPEGRHAQRELDKELCELLRELDVQVDGENLHGNVMSLHGLMESRGSKLAAVIEDPEKMAVSDWLELERALHNWKSLADEAFWMLELLLLVVPNHSEEENQEEEPHRYIPEISQETLDEDAQMLAEKLDRLSSYITRECGDWVETCRILLTGVKGAPVELESAVLNLINYDGNVAQRKLGEKRALKAEEALQEALKKIKDLERQLQGRPSVEPHRNNTNSSEENGNRSQTNEQRQK